MLCVLLLLPTALFPIFDTYRAQQAYEKKDYAKADALLNKRLTQNPDSAGIHYNLGNVAYREKKFDVAQKHYEQAGKNSDLRPHSLFNESNALAFQGKYEEALKKIEQFLQDKPNDQKAQENRDILKKLIEQKKKQEEEQKKKQDQEKKKKEEQDKKEKEQKEKSDKQDKQDQQNKSKKDQDEQKQKKEKEDKQQDQQQKDKGEQDKEQSEQDKQDQEQKNKQDEQKKKENEQPGEGERKQKEQKDQEDKGSEQEKQQPTPQEQAAKEADAKLHPELKRLLEAVESDDRKAAQKMLKGQLKQQGGVPGQKNW